MLEKQRIGEEQRQLHKQQRSVGVAAMSADLGEEEAELRRGGAGGERG